MENIDNKVNQKACIKRFEEFVTQDVDISDMFWLLDNVIINYAKYLIEDESICGGSKIDSRHLHYIIRLRNLFIEPKDV